MTQEPVWELPYTIGFCVAGQKVLMLHRRNPPNQSLWNGLGGSIESDEMPEESIIREIMEEAALNLKQAQQVRYAGIVTWTFAQDATNIYKGMYAYIAYFDPALIEWHSKDCDEGLLEWKAIDWVIDTRNPEVVDNIPQFLPRMLSDAEPVRYHCEYIAGKFRNLTLYPLSTLDAGAV